MGIRRVHHSSVTGERTARRAAETARSLLQVGTAVG